MERNPLKGGQACGGDRYLKGSKQLCKGFNQHQVQVYKIQKTSTISTGRYREENVDIQQRFIDLQDAPIFSWRNEKATFKEKVIEISGEKVNFSMHSVQKS